MQSPPLDSGEIHVWRATLAARGEVLAQHHALLADDEKTRADRFLPSRVRERFIIARAMLRHLLAAYVHSDPATLRFGYAARGKPYLVHDSELCFNLSHTEDTALIAIASRREIGIDMEATTRDVDVLGVAQKAFSSDEIARLTALAKEQRRAAFFRIWTRKEAYVKARGDGFGYPTRAFSVSHLPGDDDALLADERQAAAPLDWRLTEIVAPDGCCAALAAPGRDCRDLQEAALIGQIDDVRSEIAEYDQLRSGEATTFEASTLAGLADALIKARIARGWTQADLAVALGVAEQQIQRYESTKYAGASLARLGDIAAALKVEVRETVVLLAS